uniref:Uncharacterized protein n=1 Tax=Candidatus Kentrum sp. DK TaxID=2126562 RepID=A0A450SPV5_9GAMM|nr:MAG: hypothetical protein BECKDK2373C_GA0170839_105033 [Candidatus Kentron sp. DK]
MLGLILPLTKSCLRRRPFHKKTTLLSYTNLLQLSVSKSLTYTDPPNIQTLLIVMDDRRNPVSVSSDVEYREAIHIIGRIESLFGKEYRLQKREIGACFPKILGQ